MQVHLFSGSGFAWRVLLACQIKNAPYTQTFLQPSQTDLKSPEFMRISPRGKVPVIVQDDYVLPESMAAIAYLDRKFPEPPLFGRTPEEAGAIWRAVLDFDLYVSETLVTNLITPIVTGQVSQETTGIISAARFAHGEFRRLEQSIQYRDWFVGGAISAADIAIYPIVEATLRFGTKPEVSHLELCFDEFPANYPQLAGWLSRIRALPGYDATYPDYWRQVDEEGQRKQLASAR